MDTLLTQVARDLAPVYGANCLEDTTPALQIWYVGGNYTAGVLGAKCALTTGTGITLTVDYGAGYTTPNATDQLGLQASGTVTFATYTTLGAFMDAINGSKSWRCKLVSALRADASVNKLLTIAATLIPATGLTLMWDGSSKTVGVAITGAGFINAGLNGEVYDDRDACENAIIQVTAKATFTVSTAALVIYPDCTQAADGNGISYALTTATALVKSNTINLKDPWVIGKIGSRLIARIEVAAGATLTSIDQLDVLGKTAVLSGRRVVTGKMW